MKTKYLAIGLIITTFFILSINIFSVSSIAQDEQKTISVKNCSAEYIKTVTVGGNTFVYYDVYIILHNSGSSISSNITVQLKDNLGNLTRRGTIGQGEDKVFTFENYFIEETGDQTLYIDYFATDIGERAESNSGSTTLSLQDNGNDEENSSPGFAFILLIIGIFMCAFYKKKNYKK